MAQYFLVTGGCGFIGSHFVRLLLERNPKAQVVNVDALTYAGRRETLADVEKKYPERYEFIQADIADEVAMREAFERGAYKAVIHFAAESHVDRSIAEPGNFIQTNVVGTANLLDLTRDFAVPRFVHISTDEVYGTLGDEGAFTEASPLDPSSPYSASKAASDMLVLAAHRTYGQDVVVTRCSNNYGSHQNPEKLIPLMITKAIAEEPLPVYGDGKNVRDWIHVLDHCEAVLAVLESGSAGEVYNIGASSEKNNLEVVEAILDHLGKSHDLITFVKDRLGHDFRYAIDSRKIQRELGWHPQRDFKKELKRTVDWYVKHPQWWREVKASA